MKLMLVACCLLLASCESTSFQAAPVVEGPCDPALVGDWRPGDSEKQGSDDAELRIDSKCQLVFVDNENGKHREGPPTKAHVGSDGDNHYLWVDAAWAIARFDLKQQLPEGDLFVVRYQVKDDQLTLNLTDDRVIAHRIIDGKIPGEIRRIDGDLRNRILAPIDPAALRQPGFFKINETLLRRQAAGSSP